MSRPQHPKQNTKPDASAPKQAVIIVASGEERYLGFISHVRQLELMKHSAMKRVQYVRDAFEEEYNVMATLSNTPFMIRRQQ